MATETDVLDKTLRKLGLMKPSPRSLLLYTSDGEKKTVAVNERRRKWSPVRKVLEQYKWDRIEALNEKGDIVATYENDAAEAEDYGLSDPAFAGHDSLEIRWLALMLKAQDVALRRDKERQEVMVSHLMKLVELVMGRLVTIEKDNMSHLRRISDMMLEGTDGEEGTMSGPMLAGLLPLLPQLLGAPAAAAPATAPKPKPNGAK